MDNEKLPGINIQQPWSRLLLTGEKTIETRGYPIPQKYINRDFWLIETPGKSGKFKARVIGKIRFSGCKQYTSAEEYADDYEFHLIGSDNKEYEWTSRRKRFGWFVSHVESVTNFTPPQPRGIVYARPFYFEGSTL